MAAKQTAALEAGEKSVATTIWLGMVIAVIAEYYSNHCAGCVIDAAAWGIVLALLR